MRRAHLVPVVTAFLLAAAGCGGSVSDDVAGGGPAPGEGFVGAEYTGETTGEGGFLEEDVTADDFDLQIFDRSTVIDNEWMPLVPGTKFVYEGQAVDETGLVRRRIEFVVTDLTKVVAGVRTRILWIEDFDNDQLVEAELAFRAQDSDGNVWHVGEFPQEYEDGKAAAAPAWIAGVGGAKAGIAMEAEPRLGGLPYQQGFAPPPINWDDHARVYGMGEADCVPVACYDDVLVMEEFEPESPGAFQLKYYAPGVGNVRVGWRGLMEEEREELVLIKHQRLGPEAMAAVRADALALERRAYRVSGDVYGQTAPAEPLQEV